jgi:membrane protease YdiL (CAAX protease family)
MLLAYVFVFGPITHAWGLPSRLAYVATISFVVLPLLLLPFRRAAILPIHPGLETATNGVVLLLVAGLFVWAAVVANLGSGIDGWLREHAFAWVPSSIAASETVDLSGSPPAVLVATRIASIAMVGIIVPVAEELYFRGFLLPRMPWTGPARIVGHSALFAAAHFLSPWAFVTRMLILIPMVLAVWRTGRLSVGIWLHCGANTAGELIILAAVVAAANR